MTKASLHGNLPIWIGKTCWRPSMRPCVRTAKHKRCERRMAQRRQTGSELPPRSRRPLNATSRMMDTVALSNGVPKDQENPVLNAFTVDVEDYFQVSGFE